MAPVLEGRRTQLEAEGDVGVIHRLRGRSSNRAKRDDLRRRVLSRYREQYLGFGPTLAAEKLTVEGLPVSDETLRNWLLTAGVHPENCIRAV